MESDEKKLLEIIEIQKTHQADFFLQVEKSTFHLQNVILSRSPTPVNRPTSRGGVYFSEKFEFKIKAQVHDLRIVPLLSQSMLGPNTEFQELKITTKIEFGNLLKQVIFVINLTNTMQSSSYVELNMTIIKINIED